MHPTSDPNLLMLDKAVARLGDLADELVYVGGCAMCALVTDPAAGFLRPTKDIDVVTEVTSLGDYYKIAERFREQGFKEDMQGPYCRWILEETVVDLMPAQLEEIGSINSWYPDAASHSEKFSLPSGSSIYVVSSPYFVATKLEAFNGRGKEDYLGSHDMEDIITVINGREDIVEDILDADEKVRTHLQEEFEKLVNNTGFVQSLPGHVSYDSLNLGREKVVLDKLHRVISY